MGGAFGSVEIRGCVGFLGADFLVFRPRVREIFNFECFLTLETNFHPWGSGIAISVLILKF